MKNAFKILVLLIVGSFISCTENQEIVTNNGSIIDGEQFGIKKHKANPEREKEDVDLEEI